ncbi:cyclase family protein [Burkholderia gladioli pv. gladioli]|uniref:Cyclase n=1 Tax=Burkholderia gladioli TaxID=28095 RepID=A0A095HDK5_BURGA|nr:cyclase family protein [Burkholderia gladioli]AJW97326.1 cyclase family protein [Burkholderia gladioli]ASD79981.1 cyclase [Burkholderia gladioli pv. gladioli]AWY54773.1 cyclase [Burkholderia gladioli pv. gladioli]KGC11604.1 cyclase family protein [Burkholderia gladioli]MDJ1164241.1 cyclase family protein [Burkholderia gladioli pv. gladioli]
MRIVDLSVPIEMGVPSDPPEMLPLIEYSDHEASVPIFLSLFPGLRADQLPDGEAWASEFVHISTHSGTHMDAPWHFASTMDNGQPSRTIDEVPLEWCLQRGVKLDFRHLPHGHVATPADIDAELARSGAIIEPLTIVLVNTAAGAAYGSGDYINCGCGIGREATLHLLSMGVKIVGTDAWSWDAPFRYTRERFARDGDPTIIWEGHKAGREAEYYQMEKLHNLEAIGSHGFTVACFPVKVKNASAAWIRCAAIIDGEH